MTGEVIATIVVGVMGLICMAGVIYAGYLLANDK